LTISPIIIDCIVVGLLFISAAVGFIRGFVNEIFTLVGWVGAIILTIYFTPVCRGFARGYFESTTLADVVTAASIFLLSLAIFSIITYFFGESIKQSKLNAIDRSLGFGFGLFRGVLLLGLAYIVISFIWEKDQQPKWLAEARSHTVIEGTAEWLKDIVPEDETDKDKTKDETIKDGVKKVGKAAGKAVDNAVNAAHEKGYDQKARESLEGLFEQNEQQGESKASPQPME